MKLRGNPGWLLVVMLAACLLAAPVSAQVRAGSIYGKILDNEGNPLPGVSVVLSGPQMASLSTGTTAAGIYRFPSVPPGEAYAIKAGLPGFKTALQVNVIVTIGANVGINLVLEPGRIEEQVDVTAMTPVLDPKKTTMATAFSKDLIQSLPTARDPWVVMQLAPAIMIDRENVGGNESGQQSIIIAKGDMAGGPVFANGGLSGWNNLWLFDGVDVTDPVSIGLSSHYYDFDAFDEMTVTTGGAADVTVQTGGVTLNMVTRRGGNTMSLAGRFYLTDNGFQADNLTPALQANGIVNTNKIQQIKDYGFNAGGPIIKDKLWGWGGYGVQDIFVYTVYGTKNQSLLNNYNFKLNAQLLPNNRLEASIMVSAKENLGRNASAAKPEGSRQQGRYHWGNPLILVQDEQSLGNSLYLSLKYSRNDTGLTHRPTTDQGLAMPVVYDQAAAKYVAFGYGFNAPSYNSYLGAGLRGNTQIMASYFNDTFLGLSQEIKAGAEVTRRTAEERFGNFQGFDIATNYNTAALDTDQDGSRTAAEMVGSGWQRINWYRDVGYIGIADQFAIYLQDTITKGRFTATLGLRYDKQIPGLGAYTFAAGVDAAPNPSPWSIFDSAVQSQMSEILPSVSIKEVKGNPYILGGASHPYQWDTWSPRIGLTWDIGGDGKTIAKLALSQYGDVMAGGFDTIFPVGTGGSANFWWMDGGYGQRGDGSWGRLGAADGHATLDELYWMHASTLPAGARYVPYAVFDGSGAINAATLADLVANGFGSDPYLAGNLSGYEWNAKTALDYSKPSFWTASKSDQSSTRTREALLTLEHEIFPDFIGSLTGTYRRYDRFDQFLTYYPESVYRDAVDPNGVALSGLIIDPRDPPAEGPWYVEAGTIPSSITITYPENPDGSAVYPWGGAGNVTYSTGGAGGRPYYLPAPYYPATGSPYSVLRKGSSYSDYLGLDLVLNKRLSNRWFANASLTLQQQRIYWGDDHLDPTNKWVFDGQPFAQMGGAMSGKVAVAMYTRWMAKLSGLYELPWGFDISATINAREGWKVPHDFTMELVPGETPNPAFTSATIYTQNISVDALPTFLNVTLRLEKGIPLGAGRLYLMADVFNLFNSSVANRAYDAYMGSTNWSGAPGIQVDNSYNATYRRLSEVLNPRILRLGARFEF
ncbi:MAG: carboxypeptidase regulatory-like domain-containing protein [Candidatus Aminicenantales bacterium]